MPTKFTGHLAQALRFGHTLEIVGKTTHSSIRFYINLCTAKTSLNPRADIGLSIYCNFPENFIARNCRLCGEWGQRETHVDECGTSANPIIRGHFFKFYILCAEDRFYISIDDRQFCSYKYRCPIIALNTLEIHDDIVFLKQIDHRSIYPNIWPSNIAEPINQWAFSNDIPMKFKPGHVIILTAICYGNAGRVSINFVDKEAVEQMLLHFTIRFDQKAVVLNSMNTSYNWDHEQSPLTFPFTLNQEFKLAIAFCEKKYRTAIDGKKYVTYFYRPPNILQRIQGFKCRLENMNFDITNIDHMQLSNSNCEGFEQFSKK